MSAKVSDQRVVGDTEGGTVGDTCVALAAVVIALCGLAGVL